MITGITAKMVNVSDAEVASLYSSINFTKRSDTPNAAIFVSKDLNDVLTTLTIQQTYPTVTKTDRGVCRTYIRLSSECKANTNTIDANTGQPISVLRPCTVELIVRSPGSALEDGPVALLKTLAYMLSKASLSTSIFNDQSL